MNPYGNLYRSPATLLSAGFQEVTVSIRNMRGDSLAESFLKPLEITKLIRRVCGGSQGWMVQCEDGQFYLAKFAGNPQGSRTLVNEWIVSHVMNNLGICTPRVRILTLPKTLQEVAKLHFSLQNKNVPVSGDLHFGSLYPVNPETTVIFDMLPATVLPKLKNIADFGATWVLDKWLYNTDKRQSIFARAKSASGLALQAFMIDNGMCFNGSHWEIRDETFAMPDWNYSVYQKLNMEAECDRSVGKIQRMAPDVLCAATRSVPAHWLAPNDRECLDALMDSVLKRQKNLSSIIARHLTSLASLKPFGVRVNGSSGVPTPSS